MGSLPWRPVLWPSPRLIPTMAMALATAAAMEATMVDMVDTASVDTTDTAKGVLTLRPSPTTDTSEAMAAMAMVDTASAMVVSTGATTARGAPTLSLRPRLMLSPTTMAVLDMDMAAMVATEPMAAMGDLADTTARGALRPSPTMAMPASMASPTTATPPSLPPPLSTSPVPPPPPSLPASVAMPVLAAMSLTLPEPSISPRGRQRLTLTTDTDMVDTDMAVDITGVRQGHPTSSPKTPMAFCLLSGLGNSSYDSRAHMFDCFRMQYKPKLEPVDPAKR